MTRQAFDEACKRADVAMKARNGHTFMTILKTRCVYCNRSKAQVEGRGNCRGWFQTFIQCLWDELERKGR